MGSYVLQLKTILDQRGVRCTGCTEKSDFVKKCQETEHLDLKSQGKRGLSNFYHSELKEL